MEMHTEDNYFLGLTVLVTLKFQPAQMLNCQPEDLCPISHKHDELQCCYMFSIEIGEMTPTRKSLFVSVLCFCV